MSNTEWTLHIASDLFELTHPEDGEVRAFEAFYIQAEAPDGRRFNHEAFLRSAEIVATEDCGTIHSFPEEARRRAGKLLAAILRAQCDGLWTTPVGRQHWVETQAAYGSEAYVDQLPEIVARERAEDSLI